jgi:hypothetical protein
MWVCNSARYGATDIGQPKQVSLKPYIMQGSRVSTTLGLHQIPKCTDLEWGCIKVTAEFIKVTAPVGAVPPAYREPTKASMADPIQAKAYTMNDCYQLNLTPLPGNVCRVISIS